MLFVVFFKGYLAFGKNAFFGKGGMKTKPSNDEVPFISFHIYVIMIWPFKLDNRFIGVPFSYPRFLFVFNSGSST